MNTEKPKKVIKLSQPTQRKQGTVLWLHPERVKINSGYKLDDKKLRSPLILVDRRDCFFSRPLE
jgi:hypothetical protein